MNLEDLDTRFAEFLDESWLLSNTGPFVRAYIRLLLMYRNELFPVELNAVLERQKQLRGEPFDDGEFEKLRKSSRKKMAQDDIDNNTSRRAMLNRLLFCTLLDTEESDFFYFTEPLFEFMRAMRVPLHEAKQILESEFAGFEV